MCLVPERDARSRLRMHQGRDSVRPLPPAWVPDLAYTRCRDLEPAVDTMTTVKTNVKIGGILAAPLTPFTRDGDVWMDALPQYARYLDTHDIDGVFILGTMGEGMSLTVEERKRVAEAWMTQIADTLRLKTVIVQVGAGNLKESVELARHAEEIGATAIACMSPSYFKPTTEEVLVEYMATVAAAAPTTPFYYYDINFMTGLYLNTARFLEVAGDKIPSLAGGKISSRELPTLLDCTLVAGGRYQVMIGTDEQFLPALALGIDVPILNGFLGGIYRRLKEAFDDNDLQTARQQQILARKLTQLREKYGGGPAMVKGIMRCLGVNLGSVRLPLKDLSEEQVASLGRDLQALGLTE